MENINLTAETKLAD